MRVRKSAVEAQVRELEKSPRVQELVKKAQQTGEETVLARGYADPSRVAYYFAKPATPGLPDSEWYERGEPYAQPGGRTYQTKGLVVGADGIHVARWRRSAPDYYDDWRIGDRDIRANDAPMVVDVFKTLGEKDK